MTTTASRASTTSTWRRTCASTTSRSTRTSARAQRGRVLELGCGNGRILLPLLRAGHRRRTASTRRRRCWQSSRARRRPRSLPDARRARGRTPPAVAHARRSAACCCPVLARHLHARRTTTCARSCAACATLLVPGGLFVVDAFVPRPVHAQADSRPTTGGRSAHSRSRAAKRIHAAPRRHQPHRAPLRARQRRRRRRRDGRGRRSHPPAARPTRCAPRWSTPDSRRITEAWDYGTRPDADGRAVLHADGARSAVTCSRRGSRDPHHRGQCTQPTRP